MSSANRQASPSTKRMPDPAGAALVTVLAMQVIIGYEWLASGITKVASGSFVPGLGADLTAQSRDAAHWYRSFLDNTIIPNARTVAVLIEVGEILVGVVFIVTALIWLARWSRLSDRWRSTLLAATMLSALGATFMAVNFHLASGANHPWLIPKDGFDETVDVDAVLVMFQLALFVLSCCVLLNGRDRSRAVSTARAPEGAQPPSSAG